MDTLRYLRQALEEDDWNITSNVKNLVAAYTGDVNTTLMIEQLFGDLRKAERLLQVRWSASPAQLQCVQLRAMDHRWRGSFDVWALFCFDLYASGAVGLPTLWHQWLRRGGSPCNFKPRPVTGLHVVC